MISLELPYERQTRANWCGAAALVMAYRSFGLADTQEEVWERITGERRGVRTSALAADALRHGLSAVTVQAEQPWALLEQALAGSCRLILNHRPTMVDPTGHFSLVTGIRPSDVWLHDPDLGPNRRWTRSELEWCWEPTGRTPRIAGRTLVAIAPYRNEAVRCRVCSAPVPEATTCAGCGTTFLLGPAAALGCTLRGCPGRLWSYLFCPWCDHAAAFVDPALAVSVHPPPGVNGFAHAPALPSTNGTALAARSLPAPTVPAEPQFLAEATPLSQAPIWNLLEEHYRSCSIAAWDEVPFYVTSNPFIAETYADIILAFLEDYAGELNEAEPLYILELAAGTGCFSFYLLQEIRKRREAFGSLARLDVRYIMADFTEANARHWQQSEKLRPFVDAGILKFGVFRPQEQTIVLDAIDGTPLLGPGLNANPLIAIANYFFDSIKQDAFRITDGKLFEVKYRFARKSAPGPIQFQDLTQVESFHEVSADYFANPAYNRVLASYRAEFPDASVLFPTAALDCLANLLEISSANLLLISADLGHTSCDGMVGLHEQAFIANFGVFYYPVNYDAIRRFVEGLGGVSIGTTDNSLSIAITANYVLRSRCNLERSRFHVVEKVDRQNLSNHLFFLRHLLKSDADPGEVLRACLAFIQICNYDPNAFCQAGPRICAALADISPAHVQTLLQVILHVRENFFSAQQKYDIAYWAGRIFHGLNRFDEALECLGESVRAFGEHSSTLYYMGLCHEAMGDGPAALDCFAATARLEPTWECARDAIRRIRLHDAVVLARRK